MSHTCTQVSAYCGAEHHKVEGSNKTVVTIHMCADGGDREFKSEELDDFERDNVLDKLYTVYL